jgi:hypothetical protein
MRVDASAPLSVTVSEDDGDVVAVMPVIRAGRGRRSRGVVIGVGVVGESVEREGVVADGGRWGGKPVRWGGRSEEGALRLLEHHLLLELSLRLLELLLLLTGILRDTRVGVVKTPHLLLFVLLLLLLLLLLELRLSLEVLLL